MARPLRPSSTSRGLHAIGASLLATLAIWVAFFAGGGEGDPGPVLWLIAATALAFIGGRALSRRPGFVHRVVAAAIAGSIAVTWPGMVRSGGAPLGYANVNATLASLGVIAAIGAAHHARRVDDRRAWTGLAAALAAATVATGSVAGVASLVIAVVVLAIGVRAGGAGFSLAAGLIVVTAALGATATVAMGGDAPGSAADLVETRQDLWIGAIELLRDAPVRGVGAGEFAERAGISGDADLRWAHHGYLQVAAELGVVGLALTFGLIGWSAVVLAPRARAGMLAGAAIVVVGLHATFDYVFHAPAVILALAALVGAGAGEPGPQDHERASARSVRGGRVVD